MTALTVDGAASARPVGRPGARPPTSSASGLVGCVGVDGAAARRRGRQRPGLGSASQAAIRPDWWPVPLRASKLPASSLRCRAAARRGRRRRGRRPDARRRRAVDRSAAEAGVGGRQRRPAPPPRRTPSPPGRRWVLVQPGSCSARIASPRSRWPPSAQNRQVRRRGRAERGRFRAGAAGTPARAPPRPCSGHRRAARAAASAAQATRSGWSVQPPGSVGQAGAARPSACVPLAPAGEQLGPACRRAARAAAGRAGARIGRAPCQHSRARRARRRGGRRPGSAARRRDGRRGRPPRPPARSSQQGPGLVAARPGAVPSTASTRTAGSAAAAPPAAAVSSPGWWSVAARQRRTGSTSRHRSPRSRYASISASRAATADRSRPRRRPARRSVPARPASARRAGPGRRRVLPPALRPGAVRAGHRRTARRRVGTAAGGVVPAGHADTAPGSRPTAAASWHPAVMPQSSSWSSWCGVTPRSRSVTTSPQTWARPSSSTCTNAFGQSRSWFHELQKRVQGRHPLDGEGGRDHGADLQQLRRRRRGAGTRSDCRPSGPPDRRRRLRRPTGTPAWPARGDQLAGQRPQRLRGVGPAVRIVLDFRRRHRASLLRRISRPAAGSVLRRADTTRKSGDPPGPAVTVTLWRAVPLRRAGDAARRRAVAPTVVPVSRRRRPRAARPAAHWAARPGPAVYVGRAVGALWMGLAHGVGWAVRAVGRQAATARDLDPEHRRDGAGLLLLGLALLSWRRGLVRPAPARSATRLADTVRLFLGAIAVVLPVLLLIGACPADASARPTRSTAGRGLVGWASLLVVDRRAAAHRPGRRATTGRAWTTPAACSARASAGCWSARSPPGWPCRCWSCCCVFGLLVVTATPINKIPERLRASSLRPGSLGRPPTVGEVDDEPAEAGRAGTRAARRPPPPPAGPAEPTSTTSTRTTTAGHDEPCRRERRPAEGAGQPQAGRAAGALAAADPGRAAGAHRAGRRLQAAAAEPARRRRRAEGPQQGQRRGDRRADRRLRPVRRRRRGHRLHPRPDGHPVRGRARARASRSSGSPSCPATSRTR